MEEFDSITFELEISSVWYDITPDVKVDPSPEWNMGIMNNTPTSRVGDPEFLRFTLDNSQGNSAGLIGYYTPGHANCRTGWTSGLNVRLSFVYEGERFYKYYGKIMPDGIEVEPGIYGARTVDVTCHGFMAQAASHDFSLPELATNVTIDQAMTLLLTNMPIQPLATDFETGVFTFPTMFDTVRANTKALAEIQKLAMSEFSYIYTKGDKTGGQTLVVENRNTRTTASLLAIPKAEEEAGFLLKAGSATDYILKAGSATDKIILNLTEDINFEGKALVGGMDMAFGKNLTNRVFARTYPRKVDAAATTVLFLTQERIELAAGETKTGIRGDYRDPAAGADYVGGRNMVTPVSGTDYTMFANSDGTGTNLTANLTVTATYGTEAVEYTIQNTGGTLGYVYLQARGKGIYIYDKVERVVEDDDSQDIHGVRPLTLELKYQNDPAEGEAYANFVLVREKDPQTTVERYEMCANIDSDAMMGFLYGEPGSMVPLSEDQTAVDGNYFIMGYSGRIVNGKFVYWSIIPKSVGQDTSWLLGTAGRTELGSTTILGYPQFG
jgi:hypothetical protein